MGGNCFFTVAPCKHRSEKNKTKRTMHWHGWSHINSYSNSVWKLPGKIIWPEPSSQQFSVRATDLFFDVNVNVTWITPHLMITWAIGLEVCGITCYDVVIPGSAPDSLSGLTVSSNFLVNQLMMFDRSGVTADISLGPAHVLSHVPTHIGISDVTQ